MNKEEKFEEGTLSCEAKNNFVGDTNPKIEEDFPLSKTAIDEAEILEFWNEKNIFEKTIKNREGKKEFIFYDGPPFGTGLPHYGHVVPGTIKDVIPRYKTMRGFKVNRKWGWDCHGLPIENMIEKEIGLNSKKEIEDYGISHFNNKCENSVLRYDKHWKEIIPRTGRFVDMDNPYKTMDPEYTESLWWAFSQLDKKDLISKDFKPMHICPRCETTLSNNEVTDGYKDVKDLTLTAKFELVEELGTFVLAWTTTPWTLPGNVALAVGEDIKYVKAKNNQNSEKYIFAKELFEKIEKEAGMDLKIIEEFLGKDLIGKSYKPLFDYYSKNNKLENKENGWKIYGAEFVTTEAGTGIVHIAPAFGSDDLLLGKKNNLPWVQHVSMNGEFRKEVIDFSGMKVRKKEFHEEVDIEIIKKLAHEDKLFSKEKKEHSYPHCWRCDTPLLNYATSSWFIKTTKIKDQFVSENKKVNWIPEFIGKKRFHNWLEGNRDWAVSRSRYWGAPLPIWENEDEEYKVLGSLEDLKQKTRSKNNFVMFRHGESEANVADILSFDIGKNGDKLTIEGRKKVKEKSKTIKDIFSKLENSNNGNIDLIIASPFKRTVETAEIIKQEINFKGEIIYDKRLKEVDFGEGKSGTPNENYRKVIDGNNFNFDTKINKGESYKDVKKRIMEFFYEIDKKYEGKNIVIVSHHIPTATVLFNEQNKKNKEFSKYLENNKIENSEPYVSNFAPIPHDENYDLNYHRPYIDEISFFENGKEFKFIKEVFDCWYESGSMPFASKHYPFENTDKFNPEKGIGFPADFISEGQDQTRGWFNSMLILSTALFEKTPFKNVVVHGMLMAEDGKKMSKSLNNYPPMEKVLNIYGADALRLFLMSSSIVKGDSPSFSEKEVDDVMKKVIMKTKNILNFYILYKNDIKDDLKPENSKNILDKWILERTKKLVVEITNGLENYKIDEAARPIFDFVDDFSTWYIRRSRDRFKGENQEDKDYSLSTTKEVLKTFAKVVAPITPFIAEHVWQELEDGKKKGSVHLQDWPIVKNKIIKNFFKNDLIKKMESARKLISVGMEARVSAGIKVRQPLNSVLVIGVDEKELLQYIEIIKDELNIKNIFFALNLETAKKEFDDTFGESLKSIGSLDIEKTWVSVILDKEITSELKKEGDFREFLRQIQIRRKNKGLKVEDNIELKIDIEDNNFIESFKKDLERVAGVKNINYSSINQGDVLNINGHKLKVILIEI